MELCGDYGGVTNEGRPCHNPVSGGRCRLHAGGLSPAQNVALLAARQFWGALAGRQFSGDRDVYTQAGYPLELTTQDFFSMYLREEMAAAVVDKPVDATWRSAPLVTEPDTPDETPFEKSVHELFTRLKAPRYFERVDRLARLGNYAVLLIGSVKAQGMEGLARPLSEDGITSAKDIGYLSAYRQANAVIRSFVADVSSRRFGLPEFYDIELVSPERMSIGGEALRDGTLRNPQSIVSGGVTGTAKVHWSRVIHVAEDPIEDDVEGRPVLERVYNRLKDLQKVTASSGESFWRQVGGLLHLDIDPQAQIKPETLDDLEDEVKDAYLQMQKILITRGVQKAGYLGAGTPDPSGMWGLLLGLFSVGSGIPQRILEGSERGDLASTTDEASYYGTIEERRIKHAGPVIVRPFIDRMLGLDPDVPMKGVLEMPRDGYEIEWEPLFQLTQLEQAELAANTAKAAQALIPMGGDPREVVSSDELREILGLPPLEDMRAPQSLEDTLQSAVNRLAVLYEVDPETLPAVTVNSAPAVLEEISRRAGTGRPMLAAG